MASWHAGMLACRHGWNAWSRHLEHSESFAECAARELQEETGITVPCYTPWLCREIESDRDSDRDRDKQAGRQAGEAGR